MLYLYIFNPGSFTPLAVVALLNIPDRDRNKLTFPSVQIFANA